MTLSNKKSNFYNCHFNCCVQKRSQSSNEPNSLNFQISRATRNIQLTSAILQCPLFKTRQQQHAPLKLLFLKTRSNYLFTASGRLSFSNFAPFFVLNKGNKSNALLLPRVNQLVYCYYFLLFFFVFNYRFETIKTMDLLLLHEIEIVALLLLFFFQRVLMFTVPCPRSRPNLQLGNRKSKIEKSKNTKKAQRAINKTKSGQVR